jgi:hypothetical protein
MEAIEHHSNPESDEPDQAKRMQTSLSHLIPGQSNEKRSSRRTHCVTKAIWQKSDQFGFLPGRNTMDAILKVIDDWEGALDNKETIYAVFFDLSKAFDLVNHKRLMQKLKNLLPPYHIMDSRG